MGLAWTSHGGSTLYIETMKQKRRVKSKTGDADADESGSGNIEFTGKKTSYKLYKKVKTQK